MQVEVGGSRFYDISGIARGCVYVCEMDHFHPEAKVGVYRYNEF